MPGDRGGCRVLPRRPCASGAASSSANPSFGPTKPTANSSKERISPKISGQPAPVDKLVVQSGGGELADAADPVEHLELFDELRRALPLAVRASTMACRIGELGIARNSVAYIIAFGIPVAGKCHAAGSIGAALIVSASKSTVATGRGNSRAAAGCSARTQPSLLPRLP